MEIRCEGPVAPGNRLSCEFIQLKLVEKGGEALTPPRQWGPVQSGKSTRRWPDDPNPANSKTRENEKKARAVRKSPAPARTRVERLVCGHGGRERARESRFAAPPCPAAAKLIQLDPTAGSGHRRVAERRRWAIVAIIKTDAFENRLATFRL